MYLKTRLATVWNVQFFAFEYAMWKVKLIARDWNRMEYVGFLVFYVVTSVWNYSSLFHQSAVQQAHNLSESKYSIEDDVVFSFSISNILSFP